MSGQTIYFFLIFAPSFAHIGIPVGCFLLIVIAVLALVVLYQRFAFRRGIQTELIQISRKLEEISESDSDTYIELTVENTQKAAYILSEKLNLGNFKIMDDSRIRIYEPSAATQSVSKELLLNGVEMISITKHTESLEDYFLKLTGEECEGNH